MFLCFKSIFPLRPDSDSGCILELKVQFLSARIKSWLIAFSKYALGTELKINLFLV